MKKLFEIKLTENISIYLHMHEDDEATLFYFFISLLIYRIYRYNYYFVLYFVILIEAQKSYKKFN